MNLWEQWVSDFLQQVKAAVYPPDAETQIAAGRTAFLRLPQDERGQAALAARVALRLLSSRPLDDGAMRRFADRTFQNPEALFLLDDLLRRYPAVLGRLQPSEPPDPRALSVRPMLTILHLLQYHAEAEQDVLVGYRDPR